MNGSQQAGRLDQVVVVGVDGSEESRAALRFALEEGLRRGTAVEVVTAWVWSSPYEELDGATTAEEARDGARRMQDRLVHAAVEGLDEVPTIAQTVVHGYGAEVLIEAAEKAAMLVVGHARKGIFSRAVLGSVSEYCVRHAAVPVVVVPSATAWRSPHEADVEPVGVVRGTE